MKELVLDLLAAAAVGYLAVVTVTMLSGRNMTISLRLIFGALVAFVALRLLGSL